MNNHYTYPINDCYAFDHSVIKFCLPPKVDCDKNVLGTIITATQKQFNCNLGVLDTTYYLPAQPGKKFQIQLNFYDDLNTDPRNPTQGWGIFVTAKLYDEKRQLVTADTTKFASRKIVAHSGDHSYQTIEIDFSLIKTNFPALTCFYIEFTRDTEVIETQVFRFVEACSKTIDLRSVYRKYDCHNNYYGSPIGEFVGDDFRYDNTLLIEATTTYFGTKIDSKGSFEYLRIIPETLIPDYLMRHVSQKMLNGLSIYVNGEKWDRHTGATFQPRGLSNMFYPIIEVEKDICVGESGCN